MIQYEEHKTYLAVSGKTFQVKEALKRLGGRFDPTEKIWKLPLSSLELPAFQALFSSDRPEAHEAFQGVPLVPFVPLVPLVPLASGQDLSISGLIRMVQEVIDERFVTPVWIVGEIESASRRVQGIFLQLSEPDDGSMQSYSVQAVMWQSVVDGLSQRKKLSNLPNLASLDDILSDGMKVRCLVRVGLFQKRGQVNLTILDVDQTYTKGQLALQREEVLKKLRSMNLHEKNKKVPYPRWIEKVGLISARGSRAYSDFVHQLTSQNFPGTILFCHSASQGQATQTEVPAAISALCLAGCDVIVMTRGGGSAADLRWYDSEKIAIAIAECPVPVIAAIGHHEDRCIAEEVSFHREKTPTAAAEYLLYHVRSVQERLTNYSFFMIKVMKQLSGKKISEVQGLAKRVYLLTTIRLHGETGRIEDYRLRLKVLPSKIQIVFQGCMENLIPRLWEVSSKSLRDRLIHLSVHKDKIKDRISERLGDMERLGERLSLKLDCQNPRPWLEKGWTQLFKNGQRIMGVKGHSSKDRVVASYLDGSLDLLIENIHQHKDKKDD